MSEMIIGQILKPTPVIIPQINLPLTVVLMGSPEPTADLLKYCQPPYLDGLLLK